MIKFLLGAITGGFVSIIFMALFSVSHDERDYEDDEYQIIK